MLIVSPQINKFSQFFNGFDMWTEFLYTFKRNSKSAEKRNKKRNALPRKILDGGFLFLTKRRDTFNWNQRYEINRSFAIDDVHCANWLVLIVKGPKNVKK